MDHRDLFSRLGASLVKGPPLGSPCISPSACSAMRPSAPEQGGHRLTSSTSPRRRRAGEISPRLRQARSSSPPRSLVRLPPRQDQALAGAGAQRQAATIWCGRGGVGVTNLVYFSSVSGNTKRFIELRMPRASLYPRGLSSSTGLRPRRADLRREQQPRRRASRSSSSSTTNAIGSTSAA